jgi:hypothetical protein
MFSPTHLGSIHNTIQIIHTYGNFVGLYMGYEKSGGVGAFRALPV